MLIRQLLCVGTVFMLGMLGGCVTSTDPFQAKAPPIDLAKVSLELDALFSYSAGQKAEMPQLSPPPGDDPAKAEKHWKQVEALAAALHTQSESVADFLAEGCVGENNRGSLELRECAALADPESKNAIQQALAGVNKNRKALYYELAQFYHHNQLSVSKIEEIAAASHMTHAASGQWVQLPSAGVAFDRFLKTTQGAALGDFAVAASWVRVP